MKKTIPILSCLIYFSQSCTMHHAIHQFASTTTNSDTANDLRFDNKIASSYFEILATNNGNTPIILHWNESSMIVNGYSQPLINAAPSTVQLLANTNLDSESQNKEILSTKIDGVIYPSNAVLSTYLIGHAKYRLTTTSFPTIDFYDLGKSYGTERNLVLKNKEKVILYDYVPDSTSLVNIKIHITYSKSNQPLVKYNYEEEYTLTNVKVITKGGMAYTADYRTKFPYFISKHVNTGEVNKE
jgi:hypothetical protein